MQPTDIYALCIDELCVLAFWIRWLSAVPETVKAATQPGFSCPLFWPPPNAGPELAGPDPSGLVSRIRSSQLVVSLRIALKVPPCFFVGPSILYLRWGLHSCALRFTDQGKLGGFCMV